MAHGSMLAMVVVVVAAGASGYQLYSYHQPPSIFYPPTYYNAPPAVPMPPSFYHGGLIRAGNMREHVILPCTHAGFYVHPTNSSRFYRCVDHTGTGQFFVRYVFECPVNHTFVLGIDTCLPVSYQPPVTPSVTPPVTPSVTPPVTPTDPPSPTTTQANSNTDSSDSTDVPLGPTTVPPDPTTDLSTDSPTDPPAPSTDPITDPSVTSIPSTDPPLNGNCEGQYEQHPMYCNVYRRCNDTCKRYMCPVGTVFNEERQMCRIGAADEPLCVSKTVAAFPFLLRTEVVDGHILLPDDYVLKPLLYFPTHANPDQDHPPARLTSHPHHHHHHPPHYSHSSSDQLFLDRHAPYHGLPADTIPPWDPNPFSGIKTQLPIASYNTGANGHHSPVYSVSNVRRPQNQLHFPPYSPYHSQSDVDPFDYRLGYYYR